MADSNPELESFRQRWKEEVSARSRAEANRASSTAGPSKTTRRPPPAPRIPGERVPKTIEEDDHVPAPSYVDPDVEAGSEGIHEEVPASGGREPKTALEHYEKAVERESLGSLGDSLDLYRKAFKLDNQVDQHYKSKHFPPSYFASKNPKPDASKTQAAGAQAASGTTGDRPQTLTELIAGFSGLSIEPAAPEIEGTPALPCPIAALPHELLVHIFRELAILDIASFARSAQVCKSMAYLVAIEEQIWKRVCQGSEVGFGAMHYAWQTGVLGEALDAFPEFNDAGELVEPPEDTTIVRNSISDALLRGVYSSSWHKMFRLRPRIRFNGCYISTNNYIRPGQASPSQNTWNSPVHIVTYYRYLRFFRDGTVISLLTTTEPADVVRYITKDLMELHRSKANAHLPSVVMQSALRGRWRLLPVTENPGVDLKDAEGDLCVETEGAANLGSKYIYKMDLSLRSAGKGAKNNKLVLGGYWSYNKLTDDWAEFTRRNEKPMFWSRVKSYGTGA